MAPQALYCTQVTEKTQTGDSFTSKPLLKRYKALHQLNCE